MNYVFVFAIGIGIVAGLRSLLAPAVVAWAAHFDLLNLNGSPLAFMGLRTAIVIFTIFAIGELIADKLPKTPKRTAFAPLAARILLGGLSGACLFAATGKSLLAGALLGATGGLIGAVRRLRNPAAYREQSPHQRFLRGHLRRCGCDCSRLFLCLALTKIESTIAHATRVIETIQRLYLGDQNFFVSPGFINMTRGSFPNTARKSASVDEPGKAP
jgi:uncharacterized membrane protein